MTGLVCATMRRTPKAGDASGDEPQRRRQPAPGQAAIALESARLYRSMEEQVQQRTRELELALLRARYTEDHSRVQAVQFRLDRLEIERFGLKSPIGALEHSVRSSKAPVAIIIDDEVAALGGVVPQSWGGTFWVMTGRKVKEHPGHFFRRAKEAWALLSAEEQVLANVIDAQHRGALLLCKMFGFEVAEPTTGPTGTPIAYIEWRRPCA